MKSLMFVCLGNICRSPLAEGIAKHLSHIHQLHLEVASSGTGDWHIGSAPCPNSIKVASNHNLDISMLKAQQVSVDDFKHYDLIVALDESNKNDLEKLGCTHVEKLGDYGFHGADVPDPYFFDGFEGFEKVYEMIEHAVIQLLENKLSITL